MEFVNMTFKCIILNGPPFSGKDTIANHYCGIHESTVKMEFKGKLFEISRAIAGVTEEEWNEHYTRELKEVAWAKLQINGIAVSPRIWLQHVSENVLKPFFGKEVIGLMVVNECKQLPKETSVIFSDGGFIEELRDGLLKFYKPCEVFVARLHRDGCDFSNDTRRYLTDEELLNAHVCFDDIYIVEDDVESTIDIILNSMLEFS